MTNQINHVLSFICASALLVTGGCIGDAFDPCADSPQIMLDNPNDAVIWPPVVHTGFNGRDNYLSVISTNFIVDEWTSESPSVVSVSGYTVCGSPSTAEPAGLVISESGGTTNVSARADGIVETVQVVVTAYSEEDTDLGETRYREPTNGEPSCASCHEAVGGVDHTPLEMAYHNDAAILLATKESRYPNVCTDAVGQPCDCATGACATESPGYVLMGGDHNWTLTPAEETAIIAYMRSLRPRGI